MNLGVEEEQRTCNGMKCTRKTSSSTSVKQAFARAPAEVEFLTLPLMSAGPVSCKIIQIVLPCYWSSYNCTCQMSAKHLPWEFARLYFEGTNHCGAVTLTVAGCSGAPAPSSAPARAKRPVSTSPLSFHTKCGANVELLLSGTVPIARRKKYALLTSLLFTLHFYGL